jgi:hypothetical protein
MVNTRKEDVIDANDAAWEGDVEKLEKYVNDGVLPDIRGANSAANLGMTTMVIYLGSKLGIFPDQYSINRAALWGYLDTIQALEALNPSLLPDEQGVEMAAHNGHLLVIKYLLAQGVHATSEAANSAAISGQLHVVKYLATLTPPVLPSQRGVNSTAFTIHDEVSKYLANNFGLHPSTEAANIATIEGLPAALGNLLTWNPPIFPTQEAVDQAAKNMKTEKSDFIRGGLERVLKILAGLTPPITPTV